MRILASHVPTRSPLESGACVEANLAKQCAPAEKVGSPLGPWDVLSATLRPPKQGKWRPTRVRSGANIGFSLDDRIPEPLIPVGLPVLYPMYVLERPRWIEVF